MKTKFLLILLLSISIVGIMGGYVLLNPSYEKSLKAKYYYETGDYKEALKLSKEAFSLDIYNRMASTIMAQSVTSMKYVSYNEDAKKYMKNIKSIVSHKTISDADKAKIRTMCKIMISAYKKLSPSVVTDNKLVETAARYNTDFEKLLEKVNR